MDTTRYGLPTRTSPESLGCRWSCVVPYGPDDVIVAGEYWMGHGCPGHFAAIYTYLDYSDHHEPDDDMEVTLISGVEFEDHGHAIEWAINKIKDMR